MKIALVVDPDDRLIGTLTDGDIRRGILRGLNLDDTIETVYYRNPTTASTTDSKEKIIELAISRRIYQVPVVDEMGRVVRLAEIDHLIRKEKHPNTVVLMAGGMGTRLLPLTADTPKPMLPLGGKPILETVIGQFEIHPLPELPGRTDPAAFRRRKRSGSRDHLHPGRSENGNRRLIGTASQPSEGALYCDECGYSYSG
jgi:CBS domain-containing protein